MTGKREAKRGEMRKGESLELSERKHNELSDKKLRKWGAIKTMKVSSSMVKFMKKR